MNVSDVISFSQYIKLWIHVYTTVSPKRKYTFLSGRVPKTEGVQMKSTLFPKRNATLISKFFMVTLDQGQWPQVMSTKGNNAVNRIIVLSEVRNNVCCEVAKSHCLLFEKPFVIGRKWRWLMFHKAWLSFASSLWHSSPKERRLQKSCVSFGEECRGAPNSPLNSPEEIPTFHLVP